MWLLNFQDFFKIKITSFKDTEVFHHLIMKIYMVPIFTPCKHLTIFNGFYLCCSSAFCTSDLMQRVTKELAKETLLSQTKQGIEPNVIAKLCICIRYGLYLRKFSGLLPRLSF